MGAAPAPGPPPGRGRVAGGGGGLGWRRGPGAAAGGPPALDTGTGRGSQSGHDLRVTPYRLVQYRAVMSRLRTKVAFQKSKTAAVWLGLVTKRKSTGMGAAGRARPAGPPPGPGGADAQRCRPRTDWTPREARHFRQN